MEEDIDWSESEVKQIHSTSEAVKLMKSKDLCMLVIYAKWCSHCKKAAPQIKALSNSVKDKAKIYVIESEDYKNSDINGYPTIKIIKDGQSSTYDGQRESKAMEEALLKGPLSGGKRSRRSRTSRLRNRRRKTHRSFR